MMCLTPCAARYSKPFSISAPANTAQPSDLSQCHSDYVVFPGGYDPAPVTQSTSNHQDRYCGERFSATASDTVNKKVCCKIL